MRHEASWVPHWQARADDAENCVSGIDAWARELHNSGVVLSFGGDIPDSLDGGALLDALERFASDHWDFRGGRERNLASAPTLTAAQREALARAVGPLGLDGTAAPQRDHYDAVLMTGGMVRAGIVKPRYLRELVDAGLRLGEGTFLGAFRRFAGDEVALAHALGVAGDDEVDAMCCGMEQAFGPLATPVVSEFSSAVPTASWRDTVWQLPHTRLRVVAAPSSDPGRRRANTADTFRFWAQRCDPATSTVLVVTTPIYVPYQAAIATEVLGSEFGLAVETVAVSASASDLGEFSQRFLPHHQLQELRSAISGLRSLRRAVLASGPG